MVRTKRLNEMLPRPRSKFFQVRCLRCGNVQPVFSHSSSIVKCNVCGEELVNPVGGKAIIKGELLKELE